MEASIYIYSVLLLQITSPCPVPPLARFLYEPPTITSPKDNEILLRSKIKFQWTPDTRKNGKNRPSNSTNSILYKLEVKDRIPGKNTVNEYETKKLFILLPGEKYPAGKYQVRIATVGRFGSGKWSTETQFEIIDSKKSADHPKVEPNGNPKVEPNGNPKQVPSPNGDMVAPKKPTKPQPPFSPQVTEKPEIILPQNGDTVEIGDIEIHWTRVLNVSGYIAQLKHIASGRRTEFRTKNSRCDNCETTAIGSHNAKVAKILLNGRIDWGPEIQFEVVGHLARPSFLMRRYYYECDIEFEWTKVDGAVKYELLITNHVPQSIRVETRYTFYNMWQFRHIYRQYTVKVAAIDSFRASSWSFDFPFTISNPNWQFKASSERIPKVHDFVFQPVSKDWMLEKCDEFLSHMCNITRINRKKVVAITKSNRMRPDNLGDQIGNVLGNTFFTAISHAISNSGDHHLEVRNFVINEVINEQDRYLRDGADIDQYFAQHNTSADGNSPTDIEIVAAANVLQTAIWIYDFNRATRTWVDYQPLVYKYKEAIYLTRIGEFYRIVYNWDFGHWN